MTQFFPKIFHATFKNAIGGAILRLVERLREHVRESFRALREAFDNRSLRYLQLAWAGSIIGSWIYAVALAVYAYRHGGASAVGLVALLRWLPAAAASPLASVLGDRYPRVRVMLITDGVRAGAMAVMAVCVSTHAPVAVVYGLASLVAVITTAFQPAQAALLPSLARTPQELTAANVSSSTIESLGICVGPAIGGALLAVTSVSVVFAVTAGAFIWSALMLFLLLGVAEPPLTTERPQLWEELTAGFRAIGHDRRLRLVVGLFSAQTLVNGAFVVLVTVSALRLLDLGPSGVGYLNAAVGVGGLVGGLLSLLLVGHRRLASMFGIAIACTGAPLLVIAAFPSTVTTLVVFALIGLAIIVGDVAGYTLIQRGAPSDVLARVFGVLHSLFYATVAVGAILAPPLIDALGVRWALVVVGTVLPILCALTSASLARLDAAPVPGPQLGLLRAIPIFSPLSPPVLEQLATRLELVEAPTGTEIVRVGDPGDRFYVVSSGEVDVLVDGQAPRREGAGSYFGEIALLRDVPRTASVRAATDVELYALDRDYFVAAVTGHAASREAAEAVVGTRLGISTAV